MKHPFPDHLPMATQMTAAMLTPPRSTHCPTSVWLVWPSGRPDLGRCIGADDVAGAVYAFARQASEVPGVPVVCASSDGKVISCWSPDTRGVWRKRPRTHSMRPEGDGEGA